MRLHQFYLGIPDKLGDEYASKKNMFLVVFFLFFFISPGPLLCYISYFFDHSIYINPH